SEDFGNDDDDNEDPAAAYSQVEDVWIVQQFIEALKNADINNGDLFPDAVNNLFNPPKYPLELDNEQNTTTKPFMTSKCIIQRMIFCLLIN
ncbi:hypothetical protein H0H87_002786, partial [Tephrocybe sp. NHM501043]